MGPAADLLDLQNHITAEMLTLRHTCMVHCAVNDMINACSPVHCCARSIGINNNIMMTLYNLEYYSVLLIFYCYILLKFVVA